jgi:hypothetical protein
LGRLLTCKFHGMTGSRSAPPDDDLVNMFNQLTNAQLSKALVIIAGRLSRYLSEMIYVR